MKKIKLLVFICCVASQVCRAYVPDDSGSPITDPGWYDVTLPDISSTSPGMTQQAESTTPAGTPDSQAQAGAIAKAVTAEIQALARGLENNPVRIFNYVHDKIRHVLYFGSKKGAQLTLLERSGNDFDQCSLLMALLRAAGYTNAVYQFGWMGIPYDDSYSNYDLRHWLGLSLVNTNWSNTTNYLARLFIQRGYPSWDVLAPDDNNTFIVQRVWVLLPLGGTNYYLDPSFKITNPVAGIVSLPVAMGTFGPSTMSNNLMTVAAGTDTSTYVTNLNEGSLGNTLLGYTTNLLAYIQTNCPNASVDEVLSGRQNYFLPGYDTTMPTTIWFYTYHYQASGAPVANTVIWTNQPTNLMSSVKLTFAGTNYQCFMPQLGGQRLSLTFDSNGLAQLWLDDSNLVQNATGGSASLTNVTVFIHHTVGTWNFTSNTLNASNYYDQNDSASYQRTNATYALLYAFTPDSAWLEERQNQLETYRQQGLPDSSPQVVSEHLNIMGLSWMLQTKWTDDVITRQMGVMPGYHNRFGRMAQEAGHGYYIDVYMELTCFFPTTGYSAAEETNRTRASFLSGFFGSSLEHCLIEQLQATNLTAASSVKMLEIAITNGQAIYLANQSNWSTVQSKLINYGAALANIGNLVSSNYYILLPQNGSNHVAGPGSWAGYGYAALLSLTNFHGSKFSISGVYSGGSIENSSATVDTAYESQTSQAQQSAFGGSSAQPSVRTGADPVEMADGTFQIDAVDLSLGQGEPRGVTFSRYYNGKRRYANPAGMSGGWVHNYSIKATECAAPQPGLGLTTPAQMAPMIVASCAAVSLFNSSSPDPKNWMVTTLLAKWATDQLTKNGVSITLGKDTLQFVKQPNETFTPPADCTWTLSKSGTYSLQQRHGNTFNFDALGRVTNIVDQYNQALNVSYLSSTSSLPSTIADWKSRTLTLSYLNGALTNISDGTRSVSYGYRNNVNGQPDLVSVTDPESKTATLAYDASHQIVATSNALNQLVVSNIYDSLGHVATQYTQGDITKAWQIYSAPWITVQTDPAGGRQMFYFNDKYQEIPHIDPLGGISYVSHDSQDHVTWPMSPLQADVNFYYDGNHNVIYTVDQLGFTNRFLFDSQNNLIASVDARGSTNRFGYNAQFSLTGSTNAAGDWVTMTYNSDGTLHTRTDSAGTTTYNYDSFGQPTGITYTGGLGGEGFLNSASGNVLSHTNGRGFVTSFEYNKRRQLTNTIAPTNLVSKITVDAVGNVQTTTDPRGFVTSNFWSPTRKLLATTMPATPGGTALVNFAYDSRDLLIRTTNALGKVNQVGYDLAQRKVSTTDPIQRTTLLGYDPDNRLTAVTNAAVEITRRGWNARSELMTLTDPASNSVYYVHDGAGNLVSLTNRNGKSWLLNFDGANRLTDNLPPPSHSIYLGSSQAWNDRGLLGGFSDPDWGWTSNYFDALGRLTNRTDGVGTTLYFRDPNGNITNIVEAGQTNSWTFDAYDRVSTYRDTDGNLIQYRYDTNGNLNTVIYPRGETVTYIWDSLNRLTNVTDWANRTTTITYDLASRVKTITRPNATVRIMNYDDAGQTTNIIEQTTTGAGIVFFKLGWTNSGRIAWEFSAPLQHSYTPPSRTMTYDDDNALASINGQDAYEI